MVQNDTTPYYAGLGRTPLSMGIMFLALICIGWTSLELLGGLDLYNAIPQFSNSNNLQAPLKNSLTDESSIKSSRHHSKLFALPKTDELLPYFITGSKMMVEEDITVTAMITAEKLDVLLDVVEQYRGPMSVTLVLNPDEHEINNQVLSGLSQATQNLPSFSQWVDIHLLYSKQSLLMNVWRNIARYYARTDWIIILDIDLFPCTDFRGTILGNQTMVEMLREGHSGFVVPALQYKENEDGVDPKTFPRDKQSLMKLVNEEKIDFFYYYWPPGHGMTDYSRWYKETTKSIYKTGYESMYEPYVVFNTKVAGWCDERFVGYGHNKIVCVWEMYMAGISFYVLPEDFIIHRSHDYPLMERRYQLAYNKWVYANYAVESCILSLRRSMASGTFDAPISDHMKEMCSKFERFQEFAQHYELNIAPPEPPKDEEPKKEE